MTIRFGVTMNWWWKRLQDKIPVNSYGRTLLGAASRAILALAITPNCPKPPRTALNNSKFFWVEQVTNSPFPVTK